MLSISKDLRKLGIVSVSALMLLGVGAGISSAHANVHADGLSDALEESGKRDDAYQHQQEEEGANYLRSHPQAAIESREGETDKEWNDYEKESGYRMPKSVQDQYNKENAEDAAEEKKEREEDNLSNDPLFNGGKAKSDINVAKHAKTHHAKRQASNMIKKAVKHNTNKKRHANKKSTKRSLTKQIKALKNAQRNLRRRISKATNRKYRTRRSKRNAKRYVNRLSNQYIHNNKKLSKLTRQLKKSERKQTRRHAVRKNRARKNAKRIKSYRHRR